MTINLNDSPPESEVVAEVESTRSTEAVLLRQEAEPRALAQVGAVVGETAAEGEIDTEVFAKSKFRGDWLSQ